MSRPITKATWRPHAQKYEAVVFIRGTRFFLGYYYHHDEALRVKRQFRQYAEGADLERQKHLAERSREYAQTLTSEERDRRANSSKNQRVPVGKQLQELDERVTQRFEQLEQRIAELESQNTDSET